MSIRRSNDTRNRRLACHGNIGTDRCNIHIAQILPAIGKASNLRRLQRRNDRRLCRNSLLFDRKSCQFRSFFLRYKNILIKTKLYEISLRQPNITRPMVDTPHKDVNRKQHRLLDNTSIRRGRPRQSSSHIWRLRRQNHKKIDRCRFILTVFSQVRNRHANVLWPWQNR